MSTAQKYIRWFKDINKEDIPSVGGKGANLGEMTSFGIPVPPGFVVTSGAYFYFLGQNNLRPKIGKVLQEVNADDISSYTGVSEKIKKIIVTADFPKDLALEIMKTYLQLGDGLNDVLVAVRSSATAEDLPTASFAGQQRTFLNVKGEVNVVKAVHDCWASLFEPRAIFYRKQNHFDDFKVGIAVPVQKMIQSEASGVMFTVDPVTNAKNQLVIEAIFGLGELIVQGEVTPDRYVVNKNSLEIIEKEINSQPVQLIKVGNTTKNVKIPKEKQEKQKITDENIIEIARFGKKIHQHYFFPQDVEWAVEKGKIYIVQTRPITTLNEEKKDEETEEEKEQAKRAIILSGIAASPGIVTGPVKIISTPKELGKLVKGDILVTSMTTPDFVPAMKKVEAIITDRGGQTSHAAIVSRELGLPCVVGTEKGTKILKNGQFVTVNGKTGEVYKPLPRSVREWKKEQTRKGETFEPLPPRPPTFLKTATKVYVNLAEPELAAEVAKRNVDGVGLLRAEFIMAQMGVHPKKLIHERKQKLFISKLEEGLSTFCEHFNPRPVVYRASDFKTNEYRNLAGGKEFEPEEPNPMLGFRGAYRYISDSALFELELEAIKAVRKDYKNLHLMIPFVHTPWELREVKRLIIANGLSRTPTFKLWMMVEIPSNVILLEDFIGVGIDGISIGSNDLTMLLLGVDRDNSEVTQIFDENNPAVLWALEKVIKTCHKYNITSSICGQAPSVYPELVEKLIEWGITSISVNPDAIEKVREIVYQAEKKIAQKSNV